MRRKSRKKIERIKFYVRINAAIEDALLAVAAYVAAMYTGFFFGGGQVYLMIISLLACCAFSFLRSLLSDRMGHDKLDGLPVPRRRLTARLFDLSGYRLRDHTHVGEVIAYVGRLEDYLQSRGAIDDK